MSDDWDFYLYDADGWLHRLGEITESVDYAVCGQEVGEGWTAEAGDMPPVTGPRCVLGCFH